MQEIQIDNILGLKVYINGDPDLALMPKAVTDELCSVLLALWESEVRAQ